MKALVLLCCTALAQPASGIWDAAAALAQHKQHKGNAFGRRQGARSQLPDAAKSRAAARPRAQVALITRRPRAEWLRLLSANFSAYDVTVVVDDNTVDAARLYAAAFPTIRFVQLDYGACERKGFGNLWGTLGGNLGHSHTGGGWPKALCYLSGAVPAGQAIGHGRHLFLGKSERPVGRPII